jgi:hypothetical protein
MHIGVLSGENWTETEIPEVEVISGVYEGAEFVTDQSRSVKRTGYPHIHISRLLERSLNHGHMTDCCHGYPGIGEFLSARMDFQCRSFAVSIQYPTADFEMQKTNRPMTSRLSVVRCTSGSDLIGFPESTR